MPAPHPAQPRALAADTLGRRGAALLTSILLALLSLLCACARPLPGQGGEPMRVNFLPAPGDLLTASGDRLSPEDFIRRAEGYDYVLVGESHGQTCDHEAERRLLTLLAHGGGPSAKGGPGSNLAVGFEMVPAPNTPVLADFVAGKIAPEDLEQRLDWSKTWGHPFKGYQPVFGVLREWRLPAAGLNVPPEVIRRLSAAAMANATQHDPVAALSPEDRALLPRQIIPPAEEQKAFLREVMGGHPMGRDVSDPRQTARFELIQSVWDSAMAEQAAKLRAATGRQVAVLAGTAHVEGGLGIARRLAVLDPGTKVLLVSPWRGEELDENEAHVRVYCPLTFESRLGMTLEHRVFGEDSRVVVARVSRGSRAEAAGLRPGDEIERAGGFRMRSLNALHLAGSDAFRQKKPLRLVILRGGERYDVDLGLLGQTAPQPGPADAKP